MAEVMSQQGFGLSVPGSRQDVISALLNDYGNSFGRGDVSSSSYSPVLADKELPPPPPRSDSLDKPLPAVQRAEQRMSMKFQLRGRRILLLVAHGRTSRSAHVEILVRTCVVGRSHSPTKLHFTVLIGFSHDMHQCHGLLQPVSLHHAAAASQHCTPSENLNRDLLISCSHRGRAAVSKQHQQRPVQRTRKKENSLPELISRRETTLSQPRGQ